jgi:hypothetical protein
VLPQCENAPNLDPTQSNDQQPELAEILTDELACRQDGDEKSTRAEALAATYGPRSKHQGQWYFSTLK